MKKISYDSIDTRILSLLQADAGMTVKDIAEQVNLSSTPCWKRIQRMQDNGVIRATVALLDAQKVGLDQVVFVAIRTSRHSLEWSEQFAKQVQKMPEVVEVYRMSGEIDYMLKVVVENTRAYDAFYKRFITQVEVSDFTSMFAMEEMKYSTALPIKTKAHH
jgi:Lrp/AsnC family transcriptional regulator